MYLKEVVHLNDHAKRMNNAEQVVELRAAIEKGTGFVFKNVFEPKLILKIRDYLENVARHSLPNYVPIVEGAPNSHRINWWDERAYVKACFYQFSFYPWNQDVFKLFDVFKDTFYMKNLITGIRKDKFLTKPEEGCTARLSFQFYPSGGGGMNTHADPVDYHQLTAPIVVMSKKSQDFKKGGSFTHKSEQEKIYWDDICDIGDVIYYKSQIPHGVEPVDPDEEMDWLKFRGRWMVLPAVNKIAGNTVIANATDLGQAATKIK